ncbi:MAG: FAD-binding protein [Negativicutes bacterium]|nr:FAD-binding protein [Negativicutes bacterium]
MQTHVLTTLQQIVGASYVLAEGTETVTVSPATADEISLVLAFANREKIPVFTDGSPASGILLSLARMNSIVEVDTANLVAVVEPSVTVAALNAELEKHGLMYPPDPGTSPEVTLGETVAANPEGLRGLKYGAAKHYIMGLETILADGRILKTGGKNVKDVAGYDMTKLFTGSQQTLGIATKIIVKLMPAPETKKVLLAFFPSAEDAGKAAAALIAGKTIPAVLEIMAGAVLKAVQTYIPDGLPAEAAASLFLELDGINAAVEKELLKTLSTIEAYRPVAIRTAGDAAGREALWEVRRSVFAALAGNCSAHLIEDLTVPRTRLAEALKAIGTLAGQFDLNISILGHAATGNLLPVFAYDATNPSQTDRIQAARDALFASVRALGGTMNGAPERLESQYGAAGLAAMRAIKRALDPNCILNPGKVTGAC